MDAGDKVLASGLTNQLSLLRMQQDRSNAEDWKAERHYSLAVDGAIPLILSLFFPLHKMLILRTNRF